MLFGRLGNYLIKSPVPVFNGLSAQEIVAARFIRNAINLFVIMFFIFLPEYLLLMLVRILSKVDFWYDTV